MAEAPSPEDFVVIAVVGAVHGVRGEVRLFSESDIPGRFEDVRQVWWLGGRGERRSLELSALRPAGRFYLARFTGFDSPEEAAVLTGGRLAVPRSRRAQAPPGQYFIDDIRGLDVVDEQGRALGRVQDVYQTGANDIYVVQGQAGELLLPALRSVILDIDVARGRMTVRVPEGL